MTSTRLVGITGEAKNGKKTATNYLVEKYDAVKINFSRIVKEICHERLGLDYSQLYFDRKEDMIENGSMQGWTPLAIMQTLRDNLKNFDPSIFTADGEKQILAAWEKNKLAVLEDVGFPESRWKQEILGVKYKKVSLGEDDLVRRLGGILIKMERIKYESKTDEMGLENHNSEKLIKNIKPDYTIRCHSGEMQSMRFYLDAIMGGRAVTCPILESGKGIICHATT